MRLNKLFFVFTLVFFMLVSFSFANTVKYKYDPLNRLIRAEYPDGIVEYEYDAAGNRSSRQIRPMDADGDGFYDDWEVKQFGDLNQGPGDDHDGDSLSNLDEYERGTDPSNPDTDSDQIPDGWEITHGLNPLADDASLDPDGDKYSNLQEYLSGTTPYDSNSQPRPPLANAGPDQAVEEGSTVTLDGSKSTDGDGDIASYLWEQTDGTPVMLSNATAIHPTFTNPDVGQEGASLVFQLTVADKGGLKSTDTCVVEVTWVNVPPTAVTGPDQSP
jgi:YD repeat-containing protein